MNHDSPFGPKRAVHTPVLKDENSTRFAKLKPICVELLGNITSKRGADSTIDGMFRLLKRLLDVLSTFASSAPDRVPLSPSLINYVFFPLAQLLRNSPKGEASLPDRVRQVVFQILSSLASDWWQLWTDCTSLPSEESSSKIKEQWKVWEQLLILGAVALGGQPDGKSTSHKESSEETQISICSFLEELLLPRLAIPTSVPVTAAKEWEWDGEEDLPSLDAYEELEKLQDKPESAAIRERVQVYPSSDHLKHIQESKGCRGAVGHALSASLDIASSESVPEKVRVACLKMSRMLISYWLAGDVPQMDRLPSLYRQITVDKIYGQHCPASSTMQSISGADRVAMYLPGYVSSMVRILGTKTNNSQILTQALLSLAVILEICLCDASTESLAILVNSNGRAVEVELQQPTSIEELVARTNIDDEQDEDFTVRAKSEHNIEALRQASQSTGRSRDWLESTVAHVVIALFSIDALSSHDHTQVQIALTHLAFTLLAHCSIVLELQRVALLQKAEGDHENIDATRLLLRWIVDVSASDTNADIATTKAKESLQLLFSSRNSTSKKAHKDAVVEELRSIVQGLPVLLASRKDEDIKRKAKRVSSLLCLSTLGFDRSIDVFEGVKSVLQPSGNVDRWGASLLWSLKNDDKTSVGRDDATSIVLQGISPSASQAVMGIFEELGRALARLLQQDCLTGSEVIAPFHLIWYFMDQASSNRSTLMTASSVVRHSRLFCQNALILVDRIVKGVSQSLDDENLAVQTSKEMKKVRRLVHRFAKDIVERVSDMWEEDEEELLQQDLSLQRQMVASAERELSFPERDDGLAIVENQSGIEGNRDRPFERPDGFGPVLKLDFVSSATLKGNGSVQKQAESALQIQTEAKAQLDRSDALLLSISMSALKILGPSLKPLLLKMLYPIICGVASQSKVISEAARQTMDEMARSAGYASVQGCVSDHADYVLGTASHRLVSTLGQELEAIAMRNKDVEVVHVPLVSAQSAPLVLVEIIRMLGGEALTLIQDAIDEVLDAIDRYHLQEALCDDLLNVLVRLIEVMVNDERSKVGQAKINSATRMTSTGMIAFRPNVERDMQELERWWQSRKTRQSREEEVDVDPSLGEVQEEGQDPPSEDSQKPSASQAVVLSILEKVVPFLSHSSAMIRIRCLRLLNWGIELLCLQERTVEPLQVIEKAWPAIMSRLGFNLSLSLRQFEKVDTPAYEDLSERDFIACTEAAKLVTTLAKYLVEYLGSEKMLRQAVPRLLLLLKIVERADGRNQTSSQTNRRKFLLKDEPIKVALSTPITHFHPLQKFTPLYAMTEAVFAFLDTIINAMGPHITEDDLYRFATHPILLSCLDQRQDSELQSKASQFYLTTLTSRNENLVWFVLSGAIDKVGQFPSFLHRPDLDIHW